MTREWNASAYHRLSEHQFQWGMQVLGRIHAGGNETVLDAGCGSGRLTAELVKLLPRGHVVASDLSENMLHAARQNLCAFGPRVSFVCTDLQQLPFRGAFDGIFSTAAFHWAKDHPRLFRNLWTALKADGWLVAQCGGGPNLAQLRRHVAALISTPPYARYFENWSEPWEFATQETTAERLHFAGFVAIEAWLASAAFVLPDADTFKEYMKTVTLHAHLARLPDSGLRQEFLAQLAEQAGSKSGFVLDYWRLNINARKPR